MRETETKKPTQLHRAEATIEFLVILSQCTEIFYKTHKSIKKKYKNKSIKKKYKNMAKASTCVFPFKYVFCYFSHSICNSKHFKV